MIKIALIVLLSGILISSCQKVVTLNLASTPPQLVVNGFVTDQPGPYTINLTQSVAFYQDNVFPAVANAKVVLNDNLGNSETLINAGNGNYNSSVLQGTPGRTYTLTIVANGSTYSGSSTMPPGVPIQSLTIDSTGGGFGGGYGGGHGSSAPAKHYTLTVTLQDPGGGANYYRFVEVVEGVTKNNIYIASNAYQVGSQISKKLSSSDTSIVAGDSVTVYLQTIDYGTYEYFNTLNQTIQNASGFVQVSDPGNPASNLSNNALGYFSACSVRKMSILIK